MRESVVADLATVLFFNFIFLVFVLLHDKFALVLYFTVLISKASKNMDIKSVNMAIKYGPKIAKYGHKLVKIWT